MYNKSEIFKRAHYLFRTLSIYKTFGEALTVVWQSTIKRVKAANKRSAELKNYRSFAKPSVMIQPNLSEVYTNQRPGAYTGD